MLKMKRFQRRWRTFEGQWDQRYCAFSFKSWSEPQLLIWSIKERRAMQRKAAMEYQFRLGRAEDLRPRPRDKCVIRKRMWTLARKAGRAHCRSSPLLLLFQIQPSLIPSSVADHVLQPPLSSVEHSSPPSSLPLLIAVSQTPAPAGTAQEPTGQSSPGSI